MTQMAVALLLPADASREIDEVREKFGSARARAIVPHITVVYPFIALARIEVVIEKLKPVAGMTEPLVIELDGFDHFDEEPPVAFIAIKDPKPIAELHSRITESLRGSGEGGSEYSSDRFVPHVTVHDNVSRSELQHLMSELAGLGFRKGVVVESLGLFANEGDGWEVIHQFRLGTR